MRQQLKVSPSTTITPDMAKKLLAGNDNNRPMSERHVTVLAGAMKRGEWMLTGESIKLADDGTLLDGQHRLAAIVQSNTAVPMTIVKGVDKAAFHVIDTNSKPRGAADIMAIGGEKNPLVLAAAARLIKNWEYDPDFTIATHVWTPAELEDVVIRHPELRAFTDSKGALSKMLPPSYITAFKYLFSRINAREAAHFMDRLATGVGLEKNNPILLLRDLLIANKSARSKYAKKIIAAVVIKAFNYHLAGASPSRLEWRKDEKFPIIGDRPTMKAKKT